jgi:hypothetical protein
MNLDQTYNVIIAEKYRVDIVLICLGITRNACSIANLNAGLEERSKDLKLLAIDPGVTTGYCAAELTGKEKLVLHPSQMVDDVDEVWERLETLKPRYIVIEDFEFRQGKQKTGLNLYPVQIIGVTRLYEQMGAPLAGHQCAVQLQKAAQAKGYYTNPQLKRLGVFKPGAAWEHSMDATRHLLHWLTFSSGYQLVEGVNIADIVELA